MASRVPGIAVHFVGTVFLLAASVRAADGQVERQSLAERCRGWDITEPTRAAISTALGLADSDARVALDALDGPVRAAALAGPEDVEAQYTLATLLGARAEREEGRRKIAAARELYLQALRVIALEPDHAGASYLLGRLHAGVMRMNRVTRFLATRLLGGAALKGASWSASQTYLEVAERGAPCDPAHHYELARVYGQQRRQEHAERERRHVLDLTAGRDGRWAVIRSQVERLSIDKDR